MIRTKGSNWKIGTKDDLVYLEIWNGLNTEKVADTDFTPTQAYNIGRMFIDAALKQGYRVKRDPVDCTDDPCTNPDHYELRA